jgi:hypothetical protein
MSGQILRLQAISKPAPKENCHSERSEESRVLDTFQILHFVQDDKKNGFEMAYRPFRNKFYLVRLRKLTRLKKWRIHKNMKRFGGAGVPARRSRTTQVSWRGPQVIFRSIILRLALRLCFFA